MMAFLAESALCVGELLKRSGGMEALVLDPSAAESLEELELALHLARKSFGAKTALAKKLKYEFLLWLTGKTDIKSAMVKSAPKDPGNLLIVLLGGSKAHVLKELEAREKKKALKKNADALRLEEISLSRIKN